jgi:hypothetical protein
MSTAQPTRRWTLEQETLALEFQNAYGIEPRSISFDGEQPEPIFDFESLNRLVHTLGNFPMISTDLSQVVQEANLVIATCDIQVPDERLRHVTAGAVIGERLPNGSTIQDAAQALNVAQARALRAGLRAVGFDVVRAHRQQGEAPLPLNLVKESDSRTKDLAQAHILGKQAGLIAADGNKELWSRLISMWFNGKTSSADLTDEELVIFVARLRGLASSQPQSTPAQSALASSASSPK